MILLIDNYDSFVYNLARYLRELDQDTLVVRNDEIDAQEIRSLQPEGLVLSPGPGTPQQAGQLISIIGQLMEEYPMLGVCLGHQAIAVACGGSIIRGEQPVHGRTSQIALSKPATDTGLFQGLPNPLNATRYHSLVVEATSLPAELPVTATALEPSGHTSVMAIAHRELPIYGVQFHPESILTDGGYRLLANYLTLAGCSVPKEIPQTLQRSQLTEEWQIPDGQPIFW